MRRARFEEYIFWSFPWSSRRDDRVAVFELPQFGEPDGAVCPIIPGPAEVVWFFGAVSRMKFTWSKRHGARCAVLVSTTSSSDLVGVVVPNGERGT